MIPVSLVNRRFFITAQKTKEQAKSTVGKLEENVLFSAYDLWKKKTIAHRDADAVSLSHVLTIQDDENDDEKSESKPIRSKAISSASHLINFNKLDELQKPLLSPAMRK